MILNVRPLEVLFFLAPLIEIVFLVIPELNVEISGKLGEAFGEPLVVIALPAHAVAPPLVGTFMGAEEITDSSLVLDAKGVALSGVQKSKPREIEEAGPALAVGTSNIGDGELFVGIGSEIVLKDF